MADYTTLKLRDAEVPLRTAGDTWIIHSITFFTGMLGTTTDRVGYFDLPKGVRVMNAYINQKATLGTGPTATLVLGSLALTAATVAGTPSAKWMQDNGIAPQKLGTETQVGVLLSAAINGTGEVEVGVLVEPADFGLQ